MADDITGGHGGYLATLKNLAEKEGEKKQRIRKGYSQQRFQFKPSSRQEL